MTFQRVGVAVNIGHRYKESLETVSALKNLTQSDVLANDELFQRNGHKETS